MSRRIVSRLAKAGYFNRANGALYAAAKIFEVAVTHSAGRCGGAIARVNQSALI